MSAVDTAPSPTLLRDIYTVGPDKPIGYLPCPTIASLGFAVDTLRGWASDQQRGLESIWYRTSDGCMVFGGALYVFDRFALDKLLQRHRAILERHGWPTIARTFVERVADTTVFQENKPDLYDLIGAAFANPCMDKSPHLGRA